MWEGKRQENNGGIPSLMWSTVALWKDAERSVVGERPTTIERAMRMHNATETVIAFMKTVVVCTLVIQHYLYKIGLYLPQANRIHTYKICSNFKRHWAIIDRWLL